MNAKQNIKNEKRNDDIGFYLKNVSNQEPELATGGQGSAIRPGRKFFWSYWIRDTTFQ